MVGNESDSQFVEDMLGNNYTRRRFLTAGAVGLAAIVTGAAGYYGGKQAALHSPLNRALDELHKATYNTLAEVQGTAETQLAESVVDLKNYLGRTDAEAKKLEQYWDHIDLIEPEDFKDLEDAISKAEFYTNEAHFDERMVRLRDRMELQLAEIDRDLQKIYPKSLKDIRKFMTRMDPFKKKATEEEKERYIGRLDSLVKIYDSNRDNVIEQAYSFKETSATFSEAQKKVVSEVKTYLDKPNLTKPEKDFYEGLVSMSEKDPNGRMLGDYLLKTETYFRTIGAIEGIDEFNKDLKKHVKNIKAVQTDMDKGLRMKDEVRRSREILPEKVKEIDKLIADSNKQKKDLKRQGYDIDYDLYPNLTEAKKNATGIVNQINKIIPYVTGTAGAVLGALVAPYVTPLFLGSERKAHKKTAKELVQEKKNSLNKDRKIESLKERLAAGSSLDENIEKS